METSNRFGKKTIGMTIFAFLCITFYLSATSRQSTGCPVKTSSEFKITIDNQVFIQDGRDFLEYEMDSNSCLECHDGALAKGILFTDYQTSKILASEAIQDSKIAGKNHPVNIPYPIWNKKFVRKEALDQSLVLREGKVTCYTCHNGNYGNAYLSMPNQNSRLCLACHIK